MAWTHLSCSVAMVLAEAGRKWLDSTSRPNRSKGLHRASACCSSMLASSAGVTPCSRPAATAISLKLWPAYSTKTCTQQHSIQSRESQHAQHAQASMHSHQPEALASILHQTSSTAFKPGATACTACSGQRAQLPRVHSLPACFGQHDLDNVLHQNLAAQHSNQEPQRACCEPGYWPGCDMTGAEHGLDLGPKTTARYSNVLEPWFELHYYASGGFVGTVSIS